MAGWFKMPHKIVELFSALNPNVIITYAYLASNANKLGNGHIIGVSISDISTNTGLTKWQIRDCLKALIDVKAINLVSIQNKINVYEIIDESSLLHLSHDFPHNKKNFSRTNDDDCFNSDNSNINDVSDAFTAQGGVAFTTRFSAQSGGVLCIDVRNKKNINKTKTMLNFMCSAPQGARNAGVRARGRDLDTKIEKEGRDRLRDSTNARQARYTLGRLYLSNYLSNKDQNGTFVPKATIKKFGDLLKSKYNKQDLLDFFAEKFEESGGHRWLYNPARIIGEIESFLGSKNGTKGDDSDGSNTEI
jgi:hypothetical protein